MSLNVGELKGTIALDDTLTPSLAMASKKMESFGKTLDKLGDSATKLGRDLLPMSAALTAAGVASTVMSTKFEASMTRLVSIAGVSADELSGVKQGILDLAKESGVGPQMLAEAMTKVSSTTDDTAKAMDILTIAAKGTKAGFGDTVQVAGALTAVVNSYAKSNLSAAKAGDILAMAIKLGGAEASELAPTLANVVPQAAMLGITFEEVAANLATLTKLGVPTAEAVTQLSSVMTAMSKRTKEGEEALASIGMSYESLREKVGKEGLQATLAELNQAFAGNIDGLTDVFGRIEAVRNIMGTAGVQGEVYADTLGQIRNKSSDAGLALDEMANAMDETQVQTWSELTSLVQVLAIQFGDALAPALKDMMKAALPVLEWVRESVEWFSQLSEPVKTAAIAFTGFLAAAPVALLGIGTATSAIGGAMSLIGAAVTGPARFMHMLEEASMKTGLMATAAAKAQVQIFRAQRLIAEGWAMVHTSMFGVLGMIAAVGIAYASYHDDWTRIFDLIIPGLGMVRSYQDQWTEAIERTKAAMDKLKGGDVKAAFDIIDGFGRGTLPALRDSMGNIMLDFKTGLPAALKPVETGLYAVGAAGQVMGDGLNSLSTRTNEWQAELAKVKGEIASLTAEERANIIVGDKLGHSHEELATAASVSKEAIAMFLDQVKESKEVAEKAKKEQEDLAEFIKKQTREWTLESQKRQEEYWEEVHRLADEKGKAIIDAWVNNNNMILAANAERDRMIRERTLSTYDFQMSEIDVWLAHEKETAMKSVGNWKEAFDALDRLAAEKRAKLLAGNKELQDAMLQFPGLDPSMIVGGGMNVPGTRPGDDPLGKSIKDSLTRSLSSVPNIIVQAMTGGGNWSGALAGIGAQVGGGVGEVIGKGISMLGKFGGPIGAAIGSLAGPMVTMFANMLEKTTDNIKGIAEGYGAKISQELAQQIKNQMKELNLGEQAATILNADKLFPKVNAENFAGALKVVRDSFSMVATGQFTVAQGAKVIDDMWGKLLAVGTDSFGRINDELKELIRLNDQYGTQSKEIAAFMKDQASNAANAFNAIVKGSQQVFEAADKNAKEFKKLGDEIDKIKKSYADAAGAGQKAAEISASDQEKLKKLTGEQNEILKQQALLGKQASTEMNNLGLIAVATYGAAIEAGMTHSQALKEIGPGLKQLVTAYEQLGIQTDNAALKQLMLQGTILEHNPYLIEAVDGLGSSMIALSNMGMLNVDTFHAMQETGMQMYQRLQAAVAEHGGSTRDALLPMQDYLHQAEIQAKELGIPLDENTQMLIDQSRELGIWKEAGKSANEKLLDGVDKLNKTMQDLVNSIDRVAGGIRGIPTSVNSQINVHTNYTSSGSNAPPSGGGGDSGDSGPDAGGKAGGGTIAESGMGYLVGRDNLFVPRGTDTVPAMLTPGERVLSPSEARAYERGAGNIIVKLVLPNGKLLAEEIVPNIPAAAKRLGVTV